MPSTPDSNFAPMRGYRIDNCMMNYSDFIPRLYNWAKSLGYETGKIMPSRAFCSDESQGFPVILITKHFGTFPFNHGRVGGVVATSRHGPHAVHGKDLVIIQASHVGYDPETNTFGDYRRLQSEEEHCTPSCGKMQQVLAWYQNEYEFMQRNVRLHNDAGEKIMIIDNHLLDARRQEGLFLNHAGLVVTDAAGQRSAPVKFFSTAKAFRPTDTLVQRVGEGLFFGEEPTLIGDLLTAGDFYFKREVPGDTEGKFHLEYSLLKYMPRILKSESPMLSAAQIITQIEFDRTFRTIEKEHAYKGKRLIFISGLNIDTSPARGEVFPGTAFVPWAAYVQDTEGNFRNLEQQELVATLNSFDTRNPDCIDIDDAIEAMASAGNPA